MLAIVLSGGGANGAYEVGALQYIFENYKIQPDIYCGVSVGAINSTYLAQYQKGEELIAINNLKNLWDKINNDSIYKKWYGGWLWYLPALWKESIYNTHPVRNLIRKNLDENKILESGKKLRIIGISLNTGECKTWTEKSGDVVTGVMASSSFPIFFTPVQSRGISYSDGGLRMITPLKPAIELGADKIITITCSPEKVTFESKFKLNVLNQVTRTLDIMCNEINRDDLKKCILYNKLSKLDPKCNKRYVDITVVQPDSYLGDSLDFSPDKNKALMVLGYSDAKKVIKNL